MSFKEGLEDLDPNLVERAWANLEDDIRAITEQGEDFLTRVPEFHERIGRHSEGALAIIGYHQAQIETRERTRREISELTHDPVNESYSREHYRFKELYNGLLAAGLLLAECARLESEEE